MDANLVRRMVYGMVPPLPITEEISSKKMFLLENFPIKFYWFYTILTWIRTEERPEKSGEEENARIGRGEKA